MIAAWEPREMGVFECVRVCANENEIFIVSINCCVEELASSYYAMSDDPTNRCFAVLMIII